MKEILNCTPEYLVLVPSEADTLHGAGVVVAAVVELAHGLVAMETVEDGREASTEGDDLITQLVEADTHTALLNQASSIPQQAATNTNTNCWNNWH